MSISEQTIVIYRRPGELLNHFPGEEGRSKCKHFRLHGMERIEFPITHAAMWCTDCAAAIIKENHEQAD